MLQRVAATMEAFAPLALAEQSWDNVGTLLENPKPNGSGIVGLTIDLTPAVLMEFSSVPLAAGVAPQAASVERAAVEVILAYHPPIFSAMKRLTLAQSKQKMVLDAAVNGISIYSPHTALDACLGGINDWLVDAATGLDWNAEGVPRDVFLSFTEKCKRFDQQEKQQQQPSVPQEQSGGLFQYNARLKSSVAIAPSDGAKVLFPAALKTATSPTSSSSTAVTVDPRLGSGRIATFTAPISFTDMVNNLKKALAVPTARVSLPYGFSPTEKITKIAVCAGSGASLFSNHVRKSDRVQVLISGEMGHHDVLAANDNGQAVVLFEHTNSERGFLKFGLLPVLRAALPDVQFVVSEADRDPLVVW